MNKKDVKRIEEIFQRRHSNLIECLGYLALDLKHDVIDQDYYDKETDEVTALMNVMHYLEKEILEE
jgi:hypothetical protein